MNYEDNLDLIDKFNPYKWVCDSCDETYQEEVYRCPKCETYSVYGISRYDEERLKDYVCD